VVFAAAITRYAALLDLLLRHDRLHEPGVFDVVATAVVTGQFEGTARELFTTAHFHLPDELRGEVADAGFVDIRVHNVEGPDLWHPISTSGGPTKTVERR